MTKAPLLLESPRLSYHKPRRQDAAAIFERYSGSAEATRFMAWPRHRTVDDTYAFIAYSDDEWRRWPAGPYLIRSRDGGTLLGSTGFAFETAERAITGYILAPDAWGQGYATEAQRAMVELAPSLGIRVLTASVHAGHLASSRVLEKCGFAVEPGAPRRMVLPNLGDDAPAEVIEYCLRCPEGTA